MAPKHASETAAMNIYESSYDLSWASPTLKTGYSFTVIHLDLSFWIQEVGPNCMWREVWYWTLNIQGHLRRFGIYLDPKNIPSTKHRASRGVIIRLENVDRSGVSVLTAASPGPTPGFEKDYYRSKETLPSHVQKLSCGGNSIHIGTVLAV